MYTKQIKIIQMFLWTFFLFLGACSENGLPKYNILGGPRVLALIAEPPEVSPGATVIVKPIVSDITESVGLSYFAFSCLDYGISMGAEPSCSGNPTKITLSSGSITLLNLGHAFTGLADSVSVVIPNSSVLLDTRTAAQKFNGVRYIFEYILQNSRGEQVKSIKRLLVSDSLKVAKNNNPEISDVLINSATVTNGADLPLSEEVSTSLSYSGVPTESFEKMNSAGELSQQIEELVTTWFITDGKIGFLRTIGLDSNVFSGPATAPIDRPAYLISITRDGRGGSSYKIKCFGTACN